MRQSQGRQTQPETDRDSQRQTGKETEGNEGQRLRQVGRRHRWRQKFGGTKTETEIDRDRETGKRYRDREEI